MAQLRFTKLNLGKKVSEKPIRSEVTQPLSISKRLPPGQIDKIASRTAQKLETLPALNYVGSSISVYSFDEMKKLASTDVTTKTIGENKSINSKQMGSVNVLTSCGYCHLIDCPGHYGLMSFREEDYIYHPIYIRKVVSILTIVCNSCSKVMIDEKTIRENGFHLLKQSKRLTAMEKYCEKLKCVCKTNSEEHCRLNSLTPCNQNPKYETAHVKEQGIITYKISDKTETNEDPQSDKIKPTKTKKTIKVCTTGQPYDPDRKNPDKIRDVRDPTMCSSSLHPMDISSKGDTKPQRIHNVLRILEGITDEDAALLGFGSGRHKDDENERISRPEDMIMKGIFVTPPITRPATPSGGKTADDPITSKFIGIIRILSKLQSGDTRVSSVDLYCCIRDLIIVKSKDNNSRGANSANTVSYGSKIQAKTAIPRLNLGGKRVDHCGRTVLGPSSNHPFGWIGLPRIWSNTLTVKVKVNDINSAYLHELLRKGDVLQIVSGVSKLRTRVNMEKLNTYELQIGDTVSRKIKDGDYVIFNRQPTLHKQSLLGCKVFLHDNQTAKIHLSITTPVNADFDGDEGNVHVSQSDTVAAEIEYLISARQNIMSGETNRPSMGMVMNSVTAAYLLSDQGRSASPEFFREMMSIIPDLDVSTLNYRLKKYNVNTFGYPALISMILPPDFHYTQKGVVIREGILVSGRNTKSTVGTSSRSIIQELWKQYGSRNVDIVSDFITNMTYLSNKFLVETGFTVGLYDLINIKKDKAGNEYNENKRIVNDDIHKIELRIKALGGKLDDPVLEKARRTKIGQIANIINNTGVSISENLPESNSINTMVKAGTKGSASNVSQVSAVVGCQYFQGALLEPTLSEGTRLLPSFDFNDEQLAAIGFIKNSFFDGLSMGDLFYLHKAGREGLLDTNLETSVTGLIQRLISAAMQNLVLAEDGSIRGMNGEIFMMLYNSGYESSELVSTGDDPAMFIDIANTASQLNTKYGWVEEDTKKAVDSRKKPKNNTLFGTKSSKYPKSKKAEKLRPLKNPPEPTIKLTKYEKARLIGARSLQLGNNAPPLIDYGDEVDSLTIAKMEWDAGVIPIYSIRTCPGRKTIKVYPTKDLVF